MPGCRGEQAQGWLMAHRHPRRTMPARLGVVSSTSPVPGWCVRPAAGGTTRLQKGVARSSVDHLQRGVLVRQHQLEQILLRHQAERAPGDAHRKQLGWAAQLKQNVKKQNNLFALFCIVQ